MSKKLDALARTEKKLKKFLNIFGASIYSENGNNVFQISQRSLKCDRKNFIFGFNPFFFIFLWL